MAKESVESLLNPSLKVSRPVAACARCRGAKIKCDGRLPACSACERAGKAKECSSANDEFARGRERSYVAALETAIHRLQKKIDNTKAANSNEASFVMFAHGRPALQRRALSSTQRKEAGSMDELVSDLGFLTVNATSRDFQGFSSTMSFAKMLGAISQKEPLPLYEDETLPPRYSITHLIDHYFENFHVTLPFLSETEFMSTLSRLYQDPANSSIISSFDMWCFRLVVAISSAALCQTRGDDNYNAAVYNISLAMKFAENVIRPGSIEGIQALLLMVQYALVDPEYFDNWYLVGMASRLVVDIGLHSEPAPETKISRQELDLRRRVFYCTYALDRLISIYLGLAFSFTDDSAPNVLLPTLATDQEAKSPTQLFIRSVRPSLFLFDIRRVQSSFYQRTRLSSREEWNVDAANAYISSTLEDVHAWQSTLPDSFSPKHLQLFYLESLYSQAIVLSPNQVIPMTNLSDAHKSTFFGVAIRYSDQLRSLVQNSELRSCLTYADCCRARYVSRQFQNVMWANFDFLIKADHDNNALSPTSAALKNCNNALQFLSNMSLILEWPKQRWGISALQEIFAEGSAVLLARLEARREEYRVAQPFPNAEVLPIQQHEASLSPHGGSYSAGSLPTSPQFGVPTAQSWGPDFQSHSTFQSDDSSGYANSAMHRSNLLRASSLPVGRDTTSPELPNGTLPRRSYMFTGT